jgi:amylosucrase
MGAGFSLITDFDRNVAAMGDAFTPDRRQTLQSRAQLRWPLAMAALQELYGHRADWPLWRARLLQRLLAAAAARPVALAALDEARERNPEWFLASSMIGYCAYIDRFAGSLRGALAKVDYLAELGIRYFHPLPLLRGRVGDSDGGFAVADFRAVEPALGSLDDLEALATALRERGISLCLDIVCNHTADTHAWAQAARAGDPAFKDFYCLVSSQAEKDRLEASLHQVFPQTAPGNFTYDPAMGGWVWTTFYPFQWDLNYANPAVFIEMLDNLLFLANRGAEAFRLDSAPFLWKQAGTHCRGLPQTHAILSAWRALLGIVAPATLLKAEAILSLDEALPFLGLPARPECHMAYHNTAMTALWAALAEGDTRPFAACVADAARKPSGTGWLTYVRCHDDIIWTALADKIPSDRLAALSAFYAAETAGSFADGRAFQAPRGGVRSTNGMAASLAGRKPRQAAHREAEALDRLALLYAVAYALDGVPVIYMGDELAQMNDGSFGSDPAQAGDGRWLHRPRFDAVAARARHQLDKAEGRIFDWLKRLAAVRARLDCLGGQHPAQTLPSSDPALLLLARGPLTAAVEPPPFMCLALFKPEGAQYDLSACLGLGPWRDALTGVLYADPAAIRMRGWQALWLVRDDCGIGWEEGDR